MRALFLQLALCATCIGVAATGASAQQVGQGWSGAAFNPGPAGSAGGVVGVHGYGPGPSGQYGYGSYHGEGGAPGHGGYYGGYYGGGGYSVQGGYRGHGVHVDIGYGGYAGYYGQDDGYSHIGGYYGQDGGRGLGAYYGQDPYDDSGAAGYYVVGPDYGRYYVVGADALGAATDGEAPNPIVACGNGLTRCPSSARGVPSQPRPGTHCLPGRTWGWAAGGAWVSPGCGTNFLHPR